MPRASSRRAPPSARASERRPIRAWRRRLTSTTGSALPPVGRGFCRRSVTNKGDAVEPFVTFAWQTRSRVRPMSIDPAQPIPIYFQLKTLLLDAVLSGRYGADDRLPTEHELCNVRHQPNAGDAGAVRARRGGRDPAPPAPWVVRQPSLAEAPSGPARDARRRAGGGPWAKMIRDAAAATRVASALSRFRGHSLHQSLTHAVAEGRRARSRRPRLGLDYPSSLPPASSTRSRSSMTTGSATSTRWTSSLRSPGRTAIDGRTFGISCVRRRRGLVVPPPRARIAWDSRRPRTWAELRGEAREARGARHSPSHRHARGARRAARRPRTA